MMCGNLRLIPHGRYKWKESELDTLVSGLNQHVNLVLAPQNSKSNSFDK